MASSRLALGVAGGLIIGFLALFVIVGMTVWLGERSNTLFQETALQRDARTAAVELRDALRTAESSQRGYLLTGNEIYLAPYDTAKARALQQMSDLGRLIVTKSEPPPFFPRLQEAVQEKLGEMDQSIALKRTGSDEDALSIIRSNRGKALMDEVNIFLYATILNADETSTLFGIEQQDNAAMLRWVSIVAALVIILVVATVAITVYRNRQEIAQARDEVRAVNLTLEEREHRPQLGVILTGGTPGKIEAASRLCESAHTPPYGLSELKTRIETLRTREKHPRGVQPGRNKDQTSAKRRRI